MVYESAGLPLFTDHGLTPPDVRLIRESYAHGDARTDMVSEAMVDGLNDAARALLARSTPGSPKASRRATRRTRRHYWPSWDEPAPPREHYEYRRRRTVSIGMNSVQGRCRLEAEARIEVRHRLVFRVLESHVTAASPRLDTVALAPLAELAEMERYWGTRAALPWT